MRVIFMGTPEIAVPALNEIFAHGHDICAVYAQPPRPKGRGQKELRSPVQEAAEKLNIPVFTPKNFRNADDISQFAAHDADVAIVLAYGLLLPQAILTAPRNGCINMHGSALPRWRGAAPIQRAIMAGDKATAAMIMQMDEGLDTGPVALNETIAIGENMTAGELHDEMKMVGADLIVRALAALQRDALQFEPQSEIGVTYAKKIEKAEARIDFNRPATQVHNHIRGLSPFPGAWCEIELGGKPTRVKLLKTSCADDSGKSGEILDDKLTIACGNGSIKCHRLQRAGKGAMDATEFLRGAGTLKGQIIASP